MEDTPQKDPLDSVPSDLRQFCSDSSSNNSGNKSHMDEPRNPKIPLTGRGSGLRPMKKGETRNPNGSSKKLKMFKNFREWVMSEHPDDPQKVFKVLSDVAKKKNGNHKFVKEYLDRFEGTPTNKTELSGSLDTVIKGNISIQYNVVDQVKKEP